MAIKEIVETALAVIASIGSGGAIVAGCSKFIGKLWADRSLERYKQEFAQINIAFQNQLEVATRRVQVELDALSLVHKLRTQEEFTRLAELWKRIANLRKSFLEAMPRSLVFSNQPPEEKQASEEKRREEFGACLSETYSYIGLEALFIPKHIGDVAVRAVLTLAEENLDYISEFAPYVSRDNRTRAPKEFAKMQEQYRRLRAEKEQRFNQLTEELECLMREHIAGRTSVNVGATG